MAQFEVGPLKVTGPVTVQVTGPQGSGKSKVSLLIQLALTAAGVTTALHFEDANGAKPRRKGPELDAKATVVIVERQSAPEVAA